MHKIKSYKKIAIYIFLCVFLKAAIYSTSFSNFPLEANGVDTEPAKKFFLKNDIQFSVAGVEFEFVKRKTQPTSEVSLVLTKVNYQLFGVGNYNLFFLKNFFALGFMEKINFTFYLWNTNKKNFSPTLNIFLAPALAFSIFKTTQINFAVGFVLSAIALNDLVSDNLFLLRSGLFLELQGKFLCNKRASPYFCVSFKEIFYKIQKQQYVIEFQNFRNSFATIGIGAAINLK